MNFTALKDFMDRLTAWRIPGNSIVVTHQNREVFRYQSGFADIETREPMTTEKMLRIYSCTKIATVTAALQLYEKGYFLLNDPLYAYMPEYREMTVRCEAGEPTKAKNTITVRDLFCMTAGLTYSDANEVAYDKARRLTGGKMDTRVVAQCLAEIPLACEPGTRCKYSVCHDVLGALVEVISGMKFRDYVAEHIFKPLGMSDSVFHLTPEIKKRMATLYTYAEGDVAEGRVEKADLSELQDMGEEFDNGGGGIISTVNDYAKFISALANWGLGANGARILSRGTIELLRTNQLSGQPFADFNWPQATGYGYGLGVRTMIDRAASGSTGSFHEFGWGGAAGANALVDADTGLAAFYAHHMLNPQEPYYQPRLRNVLYTCLHS